ncbi:hypothetical protein [Niallia endozanthoxylica]|uniref:Uncharacterized protein n=1 Tax=Niallia endozanthoxylica TaxID=2036016 RepID=A0A5J5HPM4_9BACI|nr:hypothetical protein [Niallia endozanthoxylica]KAA9021808.1 hypothetical protein F4V44_17715 [Niallia endozanthoxylica]
MGLFVKRYWVLFTFCLCLVVAASVWVIAIKTEPFGNQVKGQAVLASQGEKMIENQVEIASEPFVSHSEFIQKGHQFYNDTTGWGRIEALNWEDQQKFAQLLLISLNEIGEKESLQKDLIHIQSLATFIVENNKEKEHILFLHRIFHDLDIDVNQYEHEDYFDITKYGEGNKMKEVVKHIESNSGL